MADQKFAIQKQIFEINAFSKERVHELQNRISHLVNFSLIKKMENYFRETIPADLLLRMDQLVLDIGEVNWAHMDDEIEKRFMEALEYEFSQRLEFLKSDKTRHLAGINVEITEKGNFELFEYFLLHGVLPWYADRGIRFDADKLLNQIYHANRLALRSMMLQIGKNANVRFRMSHQLSDTSIKKIISVIEPTEAEYIFQTQEELVWVQHKEQIVQEPEEGFRKTFWHFILNYLLAEMGSRFEKKMFIKSNLIQIAAHYNISYLYLLQSFYDVMATLKEKEVFQPLKTVIYELFTDESEPFSKDNLFAETIPAAEPDILSLSSGMELLQYYFYTGSLPQAYEKMAKDDIKQLVLSMTKLVPVAMQRLLLSLSKHSTGIFNFYQVMDIYEAEVLAKLICKGNVNEVENIITLFARLQRVKPFSNTTAENFKLEAWRYLLDHLLFRSETAYETTTIIRYLVKRFASARDYTESELVSVFKNSIQKLHEPGSEADEVTQLFKATLLEMDETKAAGVDEYRHDQFKDEVKAKEDDFTASRLNAAVSYLLKYGALPWWANEYFRFSLDELIRMLNEKDTDAMLLLFRKAMLVPAMKMRLASAVPPVIFKNLIEKLPEGDVVISYADELLNILEISKLVQYYATEFIQRTVFTIASEIYGNTGYALFSGVLFYYETIKRLSVLLKLKPAVFISTLIRKVEEFNSLVAENTKNLLQVLLDHFEQQRTFQKVELPADHNGTDFVSENKQGRGYEQAGISPIINASDLIQQHFELAEKPVTVIVSELSNVLRYFLQWNKLPDHLSVLKKDERKKLLREILNILFSDNLIALRSVIEDEGNAATANAYLHELFSASEGGKEKRIAEFLFEVNLQNPSVLKEQTETELYFSEQQPAGIDLANMFSKDTEMPGEIRTSKLLEESKRVLAYFLTYNRLPDDIELTEKQSIEQFLREIILFLFVQDRMFITEQFENTHASIDAKLYLYDILAISYDIRTNQLKEFVQELKDADLEKLLANTWEGKNEFSGKGVSSLINEMIEKKGAYALNQGEELLLSSASFAKMILDRYGAEMLFKLASVKISWSYASDSIIHAWLHFLQRAIQAGLYKERVLELFNRFNILFISGKLNVYDNDSYTVAFINSLSTQLGADAAEIFRQLFKPSFREIKESPGGFADQYKLIQQILRPLITRQEELKNIDAAIKSGERKKLSYVLKQDIDQLRQQLSDAIKKELQQNDGEARMEETDTGNKFKPETGESIYIANAGLVLLHPFLETYFNRTGLMENNIFIDERSRNRAVLLLQYLATGTTEHAEHELVLNKILCNVPLEEAIPVSFEATETEIEVTRELLEVVIERWDKMKNTSPEGFQSSFIMRDGLLNFMENYWNLKVEQRGYDILLQTLPWAFGYIKMSWMQHNLIVEWI